MYIKLNVPNFSLDNGVEIETEEENDQQVEPQVPEFVPSHEWQIIKPGYFSILLFSLHSFTLKCINSNDLFPLNCDVVAVYHIEIF